MRFYGYAHCNYDLMHDCMLQGILFLMNIVIYTAFEWDYECFKPSNQA